MTDKSLCAACGQLLSDHVHPEEFLGEDEYIEAMSKGVAYDLSDPHQAFAAGQLAEQKRCVEIVKQAQRIGDPMGLVSRIIRKILTGACVEAKVGDGLLDEPALKAALATQPAGWVGKLLESTKHEREAASERETLGLRELAAAHARCRELEERERYTAEELEFIRCALVTDEDEHSYADEEEGHAELREKVEAKTKRMIMSNDTCLVPRCIRQRGMRIGLCIEHWTRVPQEFRERWENYSLAVVAKLVPRTEILRMIDEMERDLRSWCSRLARQEINDD